MRHWVNRHFPGRRLHLGSMLKLEWRCLLMVLFSTNFHSVKWFVGISLICNHDQCFIFLPSVCYCAFDLSPFLQTIFFHFVPSVLLLCRTPSPNYCAAFWCLTFGMWRFIVYRLNQCVFRNILRRRRWSVGRCARLAGLQYCKCGCNFRHNCGIPGVRRCRTSNYRIGGGAERIESHSSNWLVKRRFHEHRLLRWRHLSARRGEKTFVQETSKPFLSDKKMTQSRNRTRVTFEFWCWKTLSKVTSYCQC